MEWYFIFLIPFIAAAIVYALYIKGKVTQQLYDKED